MAKVVLQGREYYIERADLERKALTLEPLPLTKFTHFIEIGGRIFPIKQLLAAGLSVSPEEMTPLEAYRILEQLGCVPQFCRNDRHQECSKL
jgi:hypothetical protein